MKKKIAVVTGVTNGIGKSVALGLIQENYHLVVIARDLNKFECLTKEALSLNRNAELKFYYADLSLCRSTLNALKLIKEDYGEIHLIYQSAGIIPKKIEITDEGVEKSFAVSYLTRYLIIRELIDLVLMTDEKLIISTAGAGQNGNIDFQDINFYTRKFSALDVVKQFQVANDLMSFYFKNKYKESNLRIYCHMPGLVNTSIHQGWPPVLKFLMLNIGSLFMKSTETAAKIPLNIIKAYIQPNGVLINGKGKVLKPSGRIKNSNFQHALIETSEDMINSCSY